MSIYFCQLLVAINKYIGQPEAYVNFYRATKELEANITTLNASINGQEEVGNNLALGASMQNNLEQQRSLDAEDTREMEAAINRLERQICSLGIRMFGLYNKATNLQTPSYDGTLIWKVQDFETKQREARQGRSKHHFSPPFFTSRRGYKACVCLYPNGVEAGQNSHISLAFVVMRGELDALQLWPFKQKVTFCLVNQNGGEHIIESFEPEESSPSFQRPKSEMNNGWCLHQFVQLESIFNGSNGFLKDDVMFIKVDINTSDLPEPLTGI